MCILYAIGVRLASKQLLKIQLKCNFSILGISVAQINVNKPFQTILLVILILHSNIFLLKAL